ncbi:hypothetical protein FHG87_015321 [Trinorchestia longiramus]|nr:hypothetical protein FHG87_015321 [Trinorchestia longiramus]
MDRLLPLLLVLLLQAVTSYVSHPPAATRPSDPRLNFGCGAAPVIRQTSVRILTGFSSENNEIYHHLDDVDEHVQKNSSHIELNTWEFHYASSILNSGDHLHFTDQPMKAGKPLHKGSEPFYYSIEDNNRELRGYVVPEEIDEDNGINREIYEYYDYPPEPRALAVEENPSPVSEDPKLLEKTMGFQSQHGLSGKKELSNVRKTRKIFQDGDFLHRSGSIALYVCDEAHLKHKEIHKGGRDTEKETFKVHSKKHKFTFKLVCRNGQWQGKHFQCGCSQLPHIKNGYYVQLGPGHTRPRQFGEFVS